MSRWELAHWIAKLRLDPPVVEAVTTLAAVLSSVVANSAFGATGKAKPTDFLIDWRKKPASEQERRIREQDGWTRWVAMATAAARDG